MPPPRVAIDLHIADAPDAPRSGVGRYAIEATRSLVAARPEWAVTALTRRPEVVAGTPAGAADTRWPTDRSIGRVAWLHAGTLGLRGAFDAWVATAFTVPVWWRGPAVVVVHDLLFMEQRNRYRGALNARYATWATRHSARRASAVVCGAPDVAERITRHLGVSEERVAVVPYGISELFFAADAPPADGLGPYALFVGTWEPRKGLELLVPMLDAVNASRASPLRLVVAGRPGWGVSGPLAALAAHPHVELRSDVGDDELAGLYAGASALVHASLAEGFGLPVAEALATGCPVVATDLPPVRAFAGDVPYYAATRTPEGLAAALSLAVSDPDGGARRVAGRRVAGGLRWAAHGERLAELVERALVERPSG